MEPQADGEDPTGQRKPYIIRERCRQGPEGALEGQMILYRKAEQKEGQRHPKEPSTNQQWNCTTRYAGHQPHRRHAMAREGESGADRGKGSYRAGR